jgi:hypothetical protein
LLRRSTLLIFAFLASLSSTIAYAQENCALPLGPLASKRSVALAIFNSIADGLETRNKRAKYVIKMQDNGGSWTIYEALKGGYSYRKFTDKNGRQMETVHVTAGGGGLGMSVDKCAAAVSDVFYQR